MRRDLQISDDDTAGSKDQASSLKRFEDVTHKAANTLGQDQDQRPPSSLTRTFSSFGSSGCLPSKMYQSLSPITSISPPSFRYSSMATTIRFSEICAFNFRIKWRKTQEEDSPSSNNVSQTLSSNPRTTPPVSSILPTHCRTA